MYDPSTSEMLETLSSPSDQSALTLQRRSFLMAVAAGAGVLAMPSWMGQFQAAATPLTPGEGVLVLLTMGGGNDGLNTFVPFNDGAYRSARESLALAQNQTLPFSNDRGFNGRLGFMKSKWDAGDVALIDGVGETRLNDLSHFTSMARHMQGHSSALRSGWLGRYIDQLDQGDDPFHSVSLGTTVPLVVKGDRRKAIAVPHRDSSLYPNMGSTHPQRQYDMLRQMGQSAGGTRPVQQLAGQVLSRSVDLSGRLSSLVESPVEEAAVVTKLRLAARLINANLGIRVISIIFGDFDSHSGQEYMHNERMDEINAGLQTFYSTLSAEREKQTLLLGVSEFGRRVKANGSAGTDHGTANTVFAIGSSVKGGQYGQQPSLTDLDTHGNMKVHVDFRNVLSNVVTTWFGADSAAVLGQDFGDIGFLNSPGNESSGGGGTPVPPPAKLTTIELKRQIGRLYLAFFRRRPDDNGEASWMDARRSGRTLASIASHFAGSNEFLNTYGSLSNSEFVELIYQNVLDRSPDSQGRQDWTSRLDAGMERGVVMEHFSQSNEFQGNTEAKLLEHEERGDIGRLYRAFFVRKPDTQGLHEWINRDLPLAEVAEHFVESQEFRTRYGSISNADFVELIYQNVLDRAPDEQGRAAWNSRLDEGWTRGQVMIGFSNSPEFRNKVDDLYDAS